jgi:hypothetical protein
MAPTDKITAAHDYSDQDLLALYREALAVITVKGQSYTISGRSFTMADIREIRQMVTHLESRISNSSPSAGPSHTTVRFLRGN